MSIDCTDDVWSGGVMATTCCWTSLSPFFASPTRRSPFLLRSVSAIRYTETRHDDEATRTRTRRSRHERRTQRDAPRVWQW